MKSKIYSYCTTSNSSSISFKNIFLDLRTAKGSTNEAIQGFQKAPQTKNY